MDIRTYDDVDPTAVLQLNLLSLDWALTPEVAAAARQTDRRLTSEFALYAVDDDGVVLGQVGLFKIPVVTRDGPEDIGGLWAVATRPDRARRGVARALIDEAHRRFRRWGLRLAILGTSRYRVAHRLYRDIGYIDLVPLAEAAWTRTSPWTSAGAKGGYVATFPDLAGLALGGGSETAAVAASLRQAIADRVAEVYRRSVAGGLGFVRRQPDFLTALRAWGDERKIALISGGGRDRADGGSALLGYASFRLGPAVLIIDELNVIPGADPAEAARAVGKLFPQRYLTVRNIMRPQYRDAFAGAGLSVTEPAWGTLMMTALDGPSDPGKLRQLFGVDDGSFVAGAFDLT